MGNPAIFDFSGGRLCLDFANTVQDRLGTPLDQLRDYDDLVTWARQGEAITAESASALRSGAARDERAAARTLAKAKDLREVIFRVFMAEAAGEVPAEDDLVRLNAFVREAYAHRSVERSSDGYTWTWSAKDDPLVSLLWPVVRSAVELLTSEERARVRECGASDCAWLFFDASRNQSRRWCDMKTCGNREKARRHYARHHHAT